MGEPTILWHYTSVRWFESIISSRSIWATHISRLNDKKEFLLGQSFALSRTKESLAEIASEPSKADSQEMFSLISARMETTKAEDLPLFIISLSDEGDLPYQWCNYTPRGQGVSIGFDRSALQRQHAPIFDLRKCIYDPAEQLGSVMNVFHHYVVRRAFKLRNGSLMTESQRVDFAFNENRAILATTMAQMKDADPYRNEQEHRLIAIVEPDDPIVRPRPNDGRPYVDYKFADDGENLPLPIIYIGPDADPDVRTKVEELMARHAPVGESEIRGSSVQPEENKCCAEWRR
jgi:hypothetical protein